MTATDFLWLQIFATATCLYLFRHLLRRRWPALLRVLLFVASVSFSFDYVANDRRIWEFSDSWHLRVLINPLENTVFAVTMAILLILLYLGLESRTPKNSR